MSRLEDQARRDLEERIGRELAEAMIPVEPAPEGFRFETVGPPLNQATTGDVTLEGLQALMEELPPPGDPVVRVECGSLAAVRAACAERYPPELTGGVIPLFGFVPIHQVADLGPGQLRAVHASGLEVIL